MIRIRLTGLAIAGLSLFALAYAQEDRNLPIRYAPTPAVTYPGGVRNLRDVQFAEISGFRPLTLDLYLPPQRSAPRPVIVFVHGGAWRHRTARDGGTFSDFPAVLASVAARGYVVASVNYRFSAEVRFPGAVQDVEMAIQWLRTQAADYNIDPQRFVAWGSSAGGHIATLIGTACGVAALEPPADAKLGKASPCVEGVIDWYGIIDLASNGTDLGKDGSPGTAPNESAYLGCEVHACSPDLLKAANPMTYIDAKDPPFLIQHGVADVSVSPKQSQKLFAALHAAGVPAELVMYPGVSHGFSRVPGGGPDDVVNREAVAKVFEFLGRYFPAGR
jgi:acetyl esterase/lipase